MPNLFWRNNLSFTRNCLNALKRVTVICSKVLYNAAAVYCQMGQWEQARDVLLSASQEKGPGRGGSMEAALESIRVSSFVFRFKVKDYLVRSWFSWKKTLLENRTCHKAFLRFYGYHGIYYCPIKWTSSENFTWQMTAESADGVTCCWFK